MEKTMDPRKIRTRKLIIDAFIELSMKKDFDKITINDIASSATVNRATFYYHFKDKYALLDKVLREEIMSEVLRDVNVHEKLNNGTIETIFMALINFHTSTISANEVMKRLPQKLKRLLNPNYKQFLQNCCKGNGLIIKKVNEK